MFARSLIYSIGVAALVGYSLTDIHHGMNSANPAMNRGNFDAVAKILLVASSLTPVAFGASIAIGQAVTEKCGHEISFDEIVKLGTVATLESLALVASSLSVAVFAALSK